MHRWVGGWGHPPRFLSLDNPLVATAALVGLAVGASALLGK